jgi:hypothetical protein
MSEEGARKLKQERMARHKDTFKDLIIQARDKNDVGPSCIEKDREYPTILLLSDLQIDVLVDARKMKN